MANSDTGKPASDQGHESYADDAKARRVLLVDASSGTLSEFNPLPVILTDTSGTIDSINLGDSTDNIDGKNAQITASALFGRTSSGTLRPIAIDSSTHATTTIDYEHHEIHAGSHFFICGFGTFEDSGSVVFCVETPPNKEHHMIFEIEGTNQTEIYIYEDATTTGGSPSVPFNNDRNSTKLSSGTTTIDPIVSDSGTLIFSQSKGLAGATPAKASSVGQATRQKEIVLKSSAKTLFHIVSRGAGNIISYCGEWYEHQRKD